MSLSLRDRKIVGAPLNFRGLVYGPINEQGVVYLFGLIANDLNMRVESIQQGYPDCTAIRYVGRGKWERVNIEFEFKSSNFDHDPEKCDILVCWEDDLPEGRRDLIKGLEIIEIRSIIDTPEVPNFKPKLPEENLNKHGEYDLVYHFRRKNVKKEIQELFEELDKEIKAIDEAIWVRFAQTAITYYSPEKNFVYLRLRQNSLFLHIYTGQKEIEGVQNVKNHENWGTINIHNREELDDAIPAIKKSLEYMREAVKNNKNTGWYAVTPREGKTKD